jgi:hypothetical protein
MCRSATATRRRQHGAAAAGQAHSMVPGHGGGRRHRNADLLRAWRDQRPASGRAWLGGRGAYHRRPNRRRSALPIKWRTAGLPNRPAGRDNLAELALPVAPLVSSQRKPRKAARTRRPAKWTVGEPCCGIPSLRIRSQMIEQSWLVPPGKRIVLILSLLSFPSGNALSRGHRLLGAHGRRGRTARPSGKKLATVVKGDDVIAQQAPPLLGTTGDCASCRPVRAVSSRARLPRGLMSRLAMLGELGLTGW